MLPILLAVSLSMPPRTPHPPEPMDPVPIDLCGSGVFIFTRNGTQLGRETYHVDCAPDRRVAARAHTQLALPNGTTIDLESTLDLDASRLPVRITAKGRAGGAPIDQRVEIAGGTGTITSGGTSHKVSIPADASYLGSNIYYTLPFIIARYDASRDGEQRIPVWPGGSVLVAYAGTDQVALPGGATRFDRYTLQFGAQHVVLWFDGKGHIAVIAVPAQQFVAAREDLTAAVEPLERALSTPGSRAASAAPDYAAPPTAPFTADEVAIPVHGYTLAGTLLLPKHGARPHPAVLMITGSGQQDRDEHLGVPGLERYRPFRQIAEALASAGVAVLRVDDRGVGASTGAETLDSATTSSFADDARAEIAYLRSRAEIDPDRIALVGHSEGATIASMIAAGDPRVAAIVLMAGPAKPGGEVSVEQLRLLLAGDTTHTAAQKDSLIARQREVVRKVITGEDIPGQRYMAWTREYFRYDPLPAIRKVRQPILVLQGGRDQQVLPEHAALLARAARDAGNRDVTERVFPTLNHLFLPSTTGAVSEYSSLEVTSLGDEVVSAIRDWLVRRLRLDNRGE